MSKITDKIVGLIPKKEFKGGRGERFIHWFGKKVSVPGNRIIIGTAALLTQPAIDLYNKKVDEETKKVSAARSAAKNIAGMTTGYFVRAGFIKLVEKCSKLPKENTKKALKFFTPSNAPKQMTYAYKQYQRSMGMLWAIGGLLITNFVIDVPLTNLLTNQIVKRIKGGENEKHQ